MNEQDLIMLEDLLKKLLAGVSGFFKDGFTEVYLLDDLSGEIRKPLCTESFVCGFKDIIEFYRENIGVLPSPNSDDPDFDAYFVGGLPDESF